MELQVTNSPFNQEQADLLNRLLPTLTDSQRIWLNGYLTALARTGTAIASLPLTAVTNQVTTNGAAALTLSKDVTVLYGSQTGNCHGLAKKITKMLEGLDFQVTLASMSDFKPNHLKKVQNLLLIVSTHGEGDAPDNAIAFYEFLHSKRAPQLEELNYSVLALGDTSYEFYCQTGKDFDKRLEELGGKRIAPRIDCDVDFDEPAAEWMNEIVTALSSAATASTLPVGVEVVASSRESDYSRTNPYRAEVLENLNLNGRGSDRETRHIELSLEGSNLQYEPGDSLGIYPENHPLLVEELMDYMGWDADERIVTNKNGDKKALREALLQVYEITVLTKPLIEQVAKLTANIGIQELLDPGREQELRSYMDNRDLLDLLQDYSLQGVTAAELTALLRRMPARLYSIASSPTAYPNEVHITVRTVRYEAKGRERYGVCSVLLSERVTPGDTLPVYIQHNTSFKLPEDPAAPIIMIGPGTGVAPFRAFLGERQEIGAEGKAWLFYGDQHFSTDFLYQLEWQRWLKEGVLTNMDVAFSRDTEHKIYVQHRMLEKSQELYRWLEDGAYVYVCGDEKRMAHDVHSALLTIVQQEGGLSLEQALAYMTQLQQQKRYQRDVY